MLVLTPKDYTPVGVKIAKIDEMSSSEFSDLKSKYSKMGHFSASQTPALLGMYGGAQSVFRQMRGEEVVDFTKPKIRFGQLAESWVANQASNMLEVDVFKEPWMLGSNQHLWVTATKDFHMANNPYFTGRWGMEVKTTSSWGIRKKLGDHLSEKTAPSYYIQSQHQMYVDELDGVINPVMIIHDESAIPWAVDGMENGEPEDEIMEEVPHEIRCFVIKRNDETIQEIRTTLIRMREIYLRGDMPPDKNGNSTAKASVNGYSDHSYVPATQNINELVAEASDLKERGRTLIDKAKAIEQEVVKKLDGNGTLTWRGRNIFSVKQVSSSRLDVKNFRADHPALAEEYTNITYSNRISY